MFLQFFIFLVGILGFYNFYWKRRNLPPGPTPWPLIGNMLSLFLNPPGTPCYKSWRQKFGNVYTYWMGELPIVCVADYSTINETFIKDAETFAGRPDFKDFYEIWRFGSYGVVFIDGDCWREHRRFALHVFRNFGVGKNLMQEKILVEVQSLLTKIHQDITYEVKEHDIAKYIDVTVGSVIHSIVFGSRLRLEEDMSEFYKIKHSVNKVVDYFGHPGVMMLWKNTKTLGRLPYFSGLIKDMKHHRDILFGFFDELIKEHKEKIDFSIDSEPKDYVEAFLREQNKREEENGRADEHFNQIQLINMCFDLWLAGQETTAKTLAWALIYLIYNPEVQKKISKELDQVVGSDQIIDMSDKANLHYLNATVNEIQRLTNLVPQNVIHRTLKDVQVGDHFIPKDTCILPQISVVLEDDKIFPDPHLFKPERFLNEDGKLKKVEELIPFSVGKRQCLGESLARMELYLFVANLCNQFKFSTIPGKEPSLFRQCAGAVGPQPFICHVEPKNHNDF